MKKGIIELRILEPEEGYVLTNGEVYSTKVFLGINDDAENWREIPEDEVPDEQQNE